MIGALFALLGAVAGIAQVLLLARSAAGRSHALAFLARFALVAIVLVLAALAGALLWGAAGWLTGFLLAVAFAHRRLR